jgi:16S rRNA (guanine527-N7)-methyltransferase
VFHVKHDGTRELADALGIPLPDAGLDTLDAFEDLLRRRAIPLGLVGAADEPVLRHRHIDDSLRAAAVLPPGRCADLGSGAGLPGIVLAIARPDTHVDLIESQRRRLGFLELVVDALGLTNATPVGRHAESVDGPFDAATARAFADVRHSWEVAESLLAPGAPLVYFAGARFDQTDLRELGIPAEVVPPPPALASAGPLVIMSRQ